MRVLVTGGLGFIGSAVIRYLLTETDHEVLNIDNGSYAGSRASVSSVSQSPRYRHIEADVTDRSMMVDGFAAFDPDAVLHLAAETHVDRSINDPSAFVETNVVGTFTLLEVARSHVADLPTSRRDGFRFVQVSTDEVFGSLAPTDPPFFEGSNYDPRSPYAASKAASDHLAGAWYHTYGLPVIVTNCSNNYGPYQFPEKLIPLMVARAIQQRRLPIYGRGDQVRDWLHVDDHARGLVAVLEHGEPGERFAIGGSSERTNLQVVGTLCRLLDQRRPEGAPHHRLIDFVVDRPGHDQRYAMDHSQIRRRLGWEPSFLFEEGLADTIDWYLSHQDWIEAALDDGYNLERLGAIS